MLWGVTKPLEFSLDTSVYTQIGQSREVEGVRALLITITALALDAVRTAWLCAKNNAFRQIVVLQRQLFEFSVKSCFYVEEAKIADRHWRSTNQQFLRVGRKLHGDKSSEFEDFKRRILADDKGFSEGTNAQTSSKPNLEDMCKRVYGDVRGVQLYGLNYSIPSAVTHGAPAAFANVFEAIDGGYRLRREDNDVRKSIFALSSIGQCGINVAASVASTFAAPKVIEALIISEKFYSSCHFDRSLLVPREFKI